MRKRLLIGVIAAVVIGVAAYVLSNWHPDTIEYHVKAYTKEYKARPAHERWIEERAPDFVVKLIDRRRLARVQKHQDALVRLGFLERGSIVVSNAEALDVMLEVFREIRSTPGNPHALDTTFFDFDAITTTNVIQFVARPRDAEIWRDLIRKADVPESRKNINTLFK